MSSHRGNLASFVKNILLLLLLIPCEIYSQGISNLWLTGYSSGIYPNYGGSNINFITGFPDTAKVNRSISFSDCNANISDSLGNLLFYTNGVVIGNAQNDTMVNGDSLNPGTYTSQATYGLRVKQGNLILPLPGSSTLYYLFHETLFYDQSVSDERVPEIYYSIVDMSLDSGRGSVTQKNVVLLSDTLTIGAITACKHANGRDWWIIFHKSKGRRYYEYLLTPTGLNGPYVQDIGYSLPFNDWIWQSCFSPNGKKFASVMARDTINVFDFDRCSGVLSNSIKICIKDSAAGRGVAFSPNSNLMYVSSMNYFYQYNTSSTNLDSSKYVVAKFDGYADIIPPLYAAFYLSQIANDGKIYTNTGNGTQWLMVTNNPDFPGASCNFVQHGFRLPTYNGFTIPNFPNYFLGADTGSVCDSLQFPIHSDENGAVEKRLLSRFPINIINTENKNPEPAKDTSMRLFTYKEFIEGKVDFKNDSINSGIYPNK